MNKKELLELANKTLLENGFSYDGRPIEEVKQIWKERTEGEGWHSNHSQGMSKKKAGYISPKRKRK